MQLTVRREKEVNTQQKSISAMYWEDFKIETITHYMLFLIFKQDMELKEGYTLEKWLQSSGGSLIYSCYLLFGTFIIPMGIILCFYYCVVKKVLANPRHFMTTVNDKQILKERERSNKRVMVI